MKKCVTLLLIGVFVVSMLFVGIGCKTTTAETTAAAETTTVAAETTAAGVIPKGKDKADKDIEIVFVCKVEGMGWSIDLEKGVVKFAENYGVNAYQRCPDTGDPAKQLQLIEDLIAKGVDAIICTPNDPKALEPIFKKANEAGIVTITHEAPSMQNVSYDVEAMDNTFFGENMMKEFAAEMGGKGKYGAFVAANTHETHVAWADAAVAYQKANFPDMELVTYPYLEDENDAKLAYDRISELIKAQPDLSGILGFDAFSPPQAAQIVKEKGLIGKIVVSGLSLPSFAEEYIKEGIINKIHLWSPAGSAYISCVAAYNAVKGIPITDGMDLKGIVPGYESVKVVINAAGAKVIYGEAALAVTKENIADYPF